MKKPFASENLKEVLHLCRWSTHTHMEQRNTDSNRDVLFSSTEDSQQKAHITFTHTIFHAQLCHTHTHTYIHTYVHTYIHTYIHTYAYYLFTYFHTQSFTTSFVFPSFPVPARTFEAQYWKKLTCGVIRSFNFEGQWKAGLILTRKYHVDLCRYFSQLQTAGNRVFGSLAVENVGDHHLLPV